MDNRIEVNVSGAGSINRAIAFFALVSACHAVGLTHEQEDKLIEVFALEVKSYES